LQPAFHRKPGRYDEDMLRIARILRVGNFIDDLAGDQHRHDDGFARAGRHLGTEPRERSTVRWNVDANFLRRRRLGEPDERLHRFQLAEEKLMLALVGIVPVLQQPLGDAGHAGIARFSPRLHTWTDLIDPRDLNEYSGIVEGFGALRRDDVTGRTPTVFLIEGPALAIIAPVMFGLFVRRVDDQMINACTGHRRV
jgi:hypothetical protein